MSAAGLDTAKQLVQRVCRAFYDSRHCILIDQLIKKEAFRDDELASRVGVKTVDLAKIAQKLVEDQLISLLRRQEVKEGQMKATQRTYYYMEYSHAIDVIKWRMYQIQKLIRGKDGNLLEQQGYVCPRCKKAYSTLDTRYLDTGTEGFICDICSASLVDNENEEDVKKSKDRMQRLVEQTKVISDLLKRMEEAKLPRFDAQQWVELNGPAGSSNATAEDGLGPVPGVGVKVELAGEDDEAEIKAKREADAAEKRAQNQLPSWIAQSTVSGEATERQIELQALEAAATADSKLDIKPSLLLPSNTLDSASDAKDDLDDYYANLDAEEAEAEVDLEGGTPLASFLGGSPTETKLDASAVPLPISRTDSPAFSGIGTPLEGGGSGESEADFAEITNAVQKGFEGAAAAAVANGNGSGKRSRDEADSGWEEGMSEDVDGGGKKARVGNGELDRDQPIAKAPDDGEDEDEDDEFEEVVDQNPIVMVNGVEYRFADVEANDAKTAEMTAEEYETFWAIFESIRG